jgi:hypothetical protein
MTKRLSQRWFWPGLALVASALGAGCGATHSGGYDARDPYARPYYPPPEVRYSFPRERFAALAHELDDRAARAHGLAEGRIAGYGPRAQEFFERIHHFSDQARAFHERYERGEIRTQDRLRGELQHLLDDARATDDAIRQARVFPEVYEEWSGVIRVLNRMIEMARV